MSLKSLFQIIILIVIFVILGSVYFKYFSNEKIIINDAVEKSENNMESNKIKKEENKKKNIKQFADTDEQKLNNTKKKITSKINKNDNKDEIPNVVKKVEYLTTDKNGNKYKILASSGRTNKVNANILDLNDVSGEITSDKRSTLYIFSDFAEYNSSTSGSKFYSNVVINFEDKQIKCENFDINMDTNFAIAYNNVVVIDPQSTMSAGKITLNIETKEIEINPDQNKKEKVKINTKQ